jgi:hypothetical protein
MKRIVIGLAVLALLALATIAGGPVLERNRWRAEMQALRDSLDLARDSADSCKVALALRQEEFLSFDQFVDSLRTRVDGFEDPDQGGVPQDEYHEYLQTFEAYNESVDAWELLAENLRAEEAACRTLIEAHNRLGDSIRGLAEGGP